MSREQPTPEEIAEREAFVPPPAHHPNDQYKITATPLSKPDEWGRYEVEVRDVMQKDPDGSENGKLVFTYRRNYDMMKTFAPFRQLRDGVWRDYALISTNYTRFEVADLQEGKIIATQDYPKITQEQIDRVGAEKAEQYEWFVGKEMPGSGFCPVEFRVIDWTEEFDQDAATHMFDINGTPRYLYDLDALKRLTGQWALYIGCVWGDDSSMKLQYIDLSRIHEGIVTAEERFGYFPLGGELSDIKYYEDGDTFALPLQVYARRSTGKVLPESDVNWGEEHED